MDRQIIINFLSALITLMIAVITRYLIPWMIAHTDSEKTYCLMRWAKEAVYAAEQVFGSGTGEQKKQYVIKMIKKIAANNGIDITEEEIDLLIEAAVGAINQEIMNSLIPGLATKDNEGKAAEE